MHTYMVTHIYTRTHPHAYITLPYIYLFAFSRFLGRLLACSLARSPRLHYLTKWRRFRSYTHIEHTLRTKATTVAMAVATTATVAAAAAAPAPERTERQAHRHTQWKRWWREHTSRWMETLTRLNFPFRSAVFKLLFSFVANVWRSRRE